MGVGEGGRDREREGTERERERERERNSDQQQSGAIKVSTINSLPCEADFGSSVSIPHSFIQSVGMRGITKLSVITGIYIVLY